MSLKKKCLKLKALATKMKDASPVDHKSKEASTPTPSTPSMTEHKKKTLQKTGKPASDSDSSLSNESWNLSSVCCNKHAKTP